MRVLEDFAKASSTVEKVQGFYDVVLPGLAARYQTYLSQTDRLLDEPTVRVVERVLGEFTRMQSDRLNLLKDLPKLCVSDSDWVSQNAQLEASVLDMVEHRPVAAVA
jgi:tRNA isopentenyl-2-thiomethyl-A-37 hydroxylase MiaE